MFELGPEAEVRLLAQAHRMYELLRKLMIWFEEEELDKTLIATEVGYLLNDIEED